MTPSRNHGPVQVKGGLLAQAWVFAGFRRWARFLLMPTLVCFGYATSTAVMTNSVIVTLCLRSAFIAHLGDAQFDWAMIRITSIAAAVSAYLAGCSPPNARAGHSLPSSAGPLAINVMI
jgi:uncharacterized membrane protein YfcA